MKNNHLPQNWNIENARIKYVKFDHLHQDQNLLNKSLCIIHIGNKEKFVLTRSNQNKNNVLQNIHSLILRNRINYVPTKVTIAYFKKSISNISEILVLTISTKSEVHLNINYILLNKTKIKNNKMTDLRFELSSLANKYSTEGLKVFLSQYGFGSRKTGKILDSQLSTKMHH